MNLLERSKELLKHSRTEVLSDPSLVKVLTEIFRFRGQDICSACPGVLSGKYDELKQIVQSGNFNNIFMAKQKNISNQAPAKARRYMLPDGKVYRPFGMGVIYTNDNLTDEIAEKLIKANPSVKKVFIDLQDLKDDPKKTDGSSEPTLEEVKAKYKELFSADAPADLSEAELRDLVKELTQPNE